MPRFCVLLTGPLAFLISASLGSARTPPAGEVGTPEQVQDTARSGALPGGGTDATGAETQEQMHARHMREMRAMRGGGAMQAGGGMHGGGGMRGGARQPGAAMGAMGDRAHDRRRWSGPWAWGAMIAMILFWLLITALVSWVVYRLASGRWSHRGGGSGERAMAVLRDRYARGEIDRAAYDRMMEDLERSR